MKPSSERTSTAKIHWEGPSEKTSDSSRFRIVGIVADARYRDMCETITPTVYVPFHAIDPNASLSAQSQATFLVRTESSNPLALASLLRQEIPRARPEFRVSRIRAQLEINESHTVRERLVAMLALFFAIVALVLAGVGLYGVLNYSVLQRRREIGIRMAIGASRNRVAWLITADVFRAVAIGAAVGWALGMESTRYIQSLLYQVSSKEPHIIALPLSALLAIMVLAMLPALSRALRIDLAETLRSE
jgi:putative ABC transport system permease protein